ncbi:SGNH/GDSL hydrolase family protein [Mesorhizobium microcysteis]|jgi:lysophospholipase L1-like esterase|uniref:SGNH/GDSL hydrolase family protein n=1 Tax=Neoaquamicrobium microcysteis TaxID=2682781 RepID=A0A5D4GS10_9HYPH|nr:SGNH/GDSL hydrolase family protein [Mesorhizobium microcysteis]TYR31138.1 SGNH/GDSL hydrolase family protein [Mesorhizobium microcysteis]
MKTVLCYGDSITWGSDAATGGRHDFADRWPNVLQKALGPDVVVVTDGLRGRTTAFDEHLAACDRNGVRILPTSLYTHAPLDLVIIMLGSNDMKPAIAGTALAALQGMRRLVEIVRLNATRDGSAEPPSVLIVAPPALCETANAEFAAMFAGGVEQSRMLASLYADLADESGCGFFDAGSVAQTTPIDGVHLDAENTRAIGKGLEPIVRMMLGI